jgi:hypothetical protein
VTNFASVSTHLPDNRGAEFFTRPIEMILEFNVGIINAFQSATASWMRRRQEAARDTIESFEKLVHCRDIGEAMTVQREWIERSMHRLDEDLNPLASHTDTLREAASAEAASAEVNAVAVLSEAAQLPTREVEEDALTAEPTHQKVQSTEKGPKHRTKPAKSAYRRQR